MSGAARAGLLVALLTAPALGAPPAASPARLARDVTELAGFGTRHALSRDDAPCRGVAAARRYIAGELRAAASAGGAVRVEEDAWTEPPDGARVPPPGAGLVNVLVVWKGADPALAAEAVLLLGHYDSRASDILDVVGDAPGADDDGSGTAGVLEAARLLAPLFAAHPPRRTVILAAVEGEEQGLLGGKRLVAFCRERALRPAAVLNVDTIGSPVGPDGTRRDAEVRLFSSNRGGEDGPSRNLARAVAEMADRLALPVRARLVFRRDRRFRGGDHIPFDEAGFPAVRLIEPAENYDHEHQDVRPATRRILGDLPGFVEPGYLARVTSLAATAVAELAGAPAPPGEVKLAGTVSHDTTLTWSAAPGAAYEVLSRDTSSATWRAVRPASEAGRFVLPFVSADDFVFAVRAVGADGARGIPVVAGESAAR